MLADPYLPINHRYFRSSQRVGGGYMVPVYPNPHQMAIDGVNCRIFMTASFAHSRGDVHSEYGQFVRIAQRSILGARGAVRYCILAHTPLGQASQDITKTAM